MVTHTFPESFMQIGPVVSRNLANKETKKDINKQRNRSKTIPRPRCIGDGVIQRIRGFS